MNNFAVSNRGFIKDDNNTGAMEGSRREAAAGSGLKLASDGSRMVQKRCCKSSHRDFVKVL